MRLILNLLLRRLGLTGRVRSMPPGAELVTINGEPVTVDGEPVWISDDA